MVRNKKLKLIAFFALFALIFAQAAISVHYIIHPQHLITISDSQDLEENEQGNPDHIQKDCASCKLLQAFHSASISDEYINAAIFNLAKDKRVTPKIAPKRFHKTAYRPRAPPLFLI